MLINNRLLNPNLVVKVKEYPVCLIINAIGIMYLIFLSENDALYILYYITEFV